MPIKAPHPINDVLASRDAADRFQSHVSREALEYQYGSRSNSEQGSPRHDPHATYKRLLSVPEFCFQTQTGRSTAYKLFAAGTVRVVKLGSRTLVPSDEVDRFIASLPSATDVGTIRKVNPNLGSEVSR